VFIRLPWIVQPGCVCYLLIFLLHTCIIFATHLYCFCYIHILLCREKLLHSFYGFSCNIIIFCYKVSNSVSGDVSDEVCEFRRWIFFCYIRLIFALNKTFFATLVHYGSKSGIFSGFLVRIDFASNQTFFTTLIYYRSKNGIERA
jgi:hypothetical protein